MRYMTVRFLYAMFFFVLSVTFAHADLAKGTEVPDFEMPDIHGENVKLSDYKGHPFILKLATTWCPSCKQQSQEFYSINDFLAENEIPVIEVFVDDSKDEVRDYIERHPLDGPRVAILDDGNVYDKYNVYMIPRVLVVNSDFEVARDGSVIDAGLLKPMLKEML